MALVANSNVTGLAEGNASSAFSAPANVAMTLYILTACEVVLEARVPAQSAVWVPCAVSAHYALQTSVLTGPMSLTIQPRPSGTELRYRVISGTFTGFIDQ